MKILVLCTGNSCRSQMAEGFLRDIVGNEHFVRSAGVEVHGLNPKAVEVMGEIGIDISTNTSNHVDDFSDIEFDYVVTVCDHAAEVCPVYPTNTGRMVHHNFSDPSKMDGTDEEIMGYFRQTRDEIGDWCRDFTMKHDLV